jgi:hypothetical protein
MKKHSLSLMGSKIDTTDRALQEFTTIAKRILIIGSVQLQAKECRSLEQDSKAKTFRFNAQKFSRLNIFG